MKKELSQARLSIVIVILLLVIDQIIKLWVKTNMVLGDSIHITDWFYIHFIENIGMAYGMTFLNKLFLSMFRIIAIGGIIYYLVKLIKHPQKSGYIICVSMILAGAIGNVIDSMFYGLIFDESTPYNVSQFVEFGTGYASFLHGKVVDMFYFPIITATWPQWMPIWGGQEFIFFSPVFNFADSCISVGVIFLFIFYRKEFEQIGVVVKKEKAKEKVDEA